MRKDWFLIFGVVFVLFLQACGPFNPGPTPTPTPFYTSTPSANAANPCFGAAVPAHWHHIVVLMFENKTYDRVIGPAPYITSLARQCATAPLWNDADFRVNGTRDGQYSSKPNYATLTSGLPPSAHGLTSDAFHDQTGVDNLYHQLLLAGLTFKDYYEGDPGGCSVHFAGDYHDPIRYYTDVADVCNAHDVPLSTFMQDVNRGKLPAFSMILPSTDHSMHNNNVSSGDAFAQTILDPLLNSKAYAKGDLAIFFLWDEDTPIPNLLLAPSITPGTIMSAPAGSPISHYSALRTWEEMLGLPPLGDAGSAPSLLSYLDGRAAGQ